MKKFFLISLMTLTCGVMAFAADAKISLSANNLNATVAEGLALELNVPASLDLDPLAIVVEVNDENLPSGKKSVNLQTNLVGEATMSSWMPKLFAFNGSQMLVSVKAKGASQAFLYDFGEFNEGKLSASVNDKLAAEAAWALITSQLEKEENDGDSYIKIAQGSFIQLGGEKAIFNKACTMMKAQWGLKSLIKDLYNATGVSEENGNEVVLYLAEGSEIAIGSKKSVATKAVTFNLMNEASYTFTTKLSDVYAEFEKVQDKDVAAEADASIKALVGLADEFFGYIGAAPANYLTINVGEIESETEQALQPEDAEAPETGVWTSIRAGLTPNYYYTVCLPYGVDSYRGGMFYVINQKIGNDVELISVNSLTAGVPYVCIPSAAEVEGQFNSSHADDALAYRGLIGTFKNIQIKTNEGDYYVFGNEGIKKCAATCFLAANRAYIDMTAAAQVQPLSEQQAAGRRRLVIGINNTPTAIDEVAAENVEGTKKMMVNGQLIIIRDGVKYNAQGAVVE